MVEISKLLFEETCRNLDCNMLLHPWNESCIRTIPVSIFLSYLGSAKFYSVIYAAQILMRGKKLKKKEEWLKMGEYYLRSTALGCVVCATSSIFGCIFRKILGGKFQYYAIFLIPSTINGFCIYLEPPSRRGLIINLFSSLMLEYWFRIMDKAGYISMTKSKQTIMFMLGSAFLFYLMRLEGNKKERTPVFWLYTPEKVKQKTSDDENPCPHRGSCRQHILKGAAKNFGLGAALSLARVLLPKISSPVIAIASIQRRHFKMGLFFGFYIGIYRQFRRLSYWIISGTAHLISKCSEWISIIIYPAAVICYLCRKQDADSALYALPAGYLAGLSFLFSPSLGFATASVTAALKLYSTILYEKEVLTTKIPLPELLYCICQGTLFHARLLHPTTCPSYVFKLTDGVSYGRSAIIAGLLQEAVKMK